MSSHGTCAPSPGLAVTREHQNRKVRHCRLVLHTGESRITLSTCDRHEGVSRRCGEHYAAWNIIQPNRFGTLTAVRYRDEILRLSHLTLVQWTLGISWCRTVPRLSARPHVARVCWQFLNDERHWGHWPAPLFLWPKSNCSYGTLCITYGHKLSRSSLIPRSRSGRRSPGPPSTNSSGAYMVMWGARNTTESHYELLR